MYRLARRRRWTIGTRNHSAGFQGIQLNLHLFLRLLDLQSLTPYVETMVAGCWGNKTDNRLSFERCSFFAALVAKLVVMLALMPNVRKLAPFGQWYCHAITPTKHLSSRVSLVGVG
jgi:hypothetical protein